MTSEGPRRPILCVAHHGASDVGLIAGFLEKQGETVDLRQPNAGDPLPALDEVSAAVFLGGAMSANDDHDPAIRAELDWIDRALGTGTPLLGVCLGGQMIARMLGARVAPRDDGLWEIGYRRIRPTAEGATVFTESDTFFQWHGEGFELPEGAVALAGGAVFPNQAYRYGERVVGLQFHPEVKAAQLREWHRNHPEDLAKPGGDPLPQQISDDERHRAGVERWLEGFLARWLAEA